MKVNHGVTDKTYEHINTFVQCTSISILFVQA